MQKVIIVLFILTLSVGCKEKENPKVKVLKLAHSLSLSHPVHEAMEFFAERLKEKSGGTLQIEIYPSSQLGGEKECLELLQLGSLAMTKVSSAVLENFNPQMRVFGYPYLFEDKEKRYRFYDSKLGKELLVGGERYWLRGLTYFDAGNRSFYTKEKAIHSPKDLEGLKIRVMQSPTAIQLVKQLGASATPVSWGELYTSLQQGVVDGAENNIPSFYTSKHYEIAKYFSIDAHVSIPDVLVMSTIIYNELNEDEKAWINAAAQEAAVKQRKLWEKAEKEALRKIEKAGVEIYYPEKNLFRKKSEPLIDEVKSTDHDLYELYEKISGM